MAQGVLGFKQIRTDPSPALTTALGHLEDRLDRGEEIAGRQLEGVRIVRAASQRKLELRRGLTGTHLSHLVHVGKAASREVPELAQKFVFRQAAVATSASAPPPAVWSQRPRPIAMCC
jgi:hypothetical protein